MRIVRAISYFCKFHSAGQWAADWKRIVCWGNFDREVQCVSEVRSNRYTGILSAEGGWWRIVGAEWNLAQRRPLVDFFFFWGGASTFSTQSHIMYPPSSCTTQLCYVPLPAAFASQILRELPRPWTFHDAPRLHDNRHMKVVRLSALRTGCLYPPRNIPGSHFC
jgi:hypothetical protein